MRGGPQVPRDLGLCRERQEMTLSRGDSPGDGAATEESSSSSVSLPKEEESGVTVSVPHQETETVYETAARLLFMSVRWTKNLASFSALAGSDQALLLEESWSELFLLCSIQWSSPPASTSIFSASQFPELPPALSQALALLHSSLHMFSQLNIDPAEFACMKAIVLFKPGQLQSAQYSIVHILTELV